MGADDPAWCGPWSHGLSGEEAASRLTKVGPNVLVSGPRARFLRSVLERFGSPLVLLLLGASLLEVLTGDLPSALIVILIVASSVLLDAVQEHRAGQAAERLRHATEVRANVMRDGRVQRLPASVLVPGDLVLLAAGDLVPADGILVQARDLFVNQARLTGESYPVEKQAAPDHLSEDPFSSPAGVLLGSSIVSGSARMIVTRTGVRTTLGQVGSTLARRPPPRSFEVATRDFGLLILRLTFVLVAFVLLVNVVRGREWSESFLFAIALAVGLTPELLPAVVSVALARGALRMAERHVLVKRLAAIHDLGSMDVLCTDKTGTLTEARVELERALSPDGSPSSHVLQLAWLNSRFESGIQSPLDEALLRHEEVDLDGWEKIDEVPFDFERRRVSVLIAREGERLLVVKGAFEDVLRLATHCEDGGFDGVRVLEEEVRQQLVSRFEDLGREGLRVLGVAWKRESPDCGHVVLDDENELVFAGFVAFADPPKASAGPALRALEKAGVRIVIVTGDTELVAEHVCRELAVPVLGVVTGADLDELDDSALAARMESVNLCCRVTPSQKNRILQSLRRRGHVVGFLGDGINDAPSLHEADVGISVESAVDVTREAADLILLDQDLVVLREAILEGRRTLGNVRKYVLMGTSSNFGNMFSMAAASLFLPFLPMLPMQILVNNLLYDISEVPIPTDEVDEAFLARPHRWDMGFIRRFMVTMGPVSSVFDLATFALLLHLVGDDAASFQTGWFLESLATQVLVIFILRTQGRPWESRPSRTLTGTALGVLGVAFVLPFSPAGGALGFRPLPFFFLGALLPLVASYLVTVEGVKRWFFRRHAASAGSEG